MLPSTHDIDKLINLALEEDIGRCDVTSASTIDADLHTEFTIKARQPMVVCGIPIASRVFSELSLDIQLQPQAKDGNLLQAGDTILQGSGNAQVILAGERVALNLLGHLSGIASLTHEFVEAVKGTNAKILDTRKTLPGLRALQKYAVTVGGGHNHRFRLDDGILIKDNHISICGSLTQAIERARKHAPTLTRIEVECDTLEQVREALDAKADIILLDNMDIASLEKAVALANGNIPLEASGNVSLDTIASIAQTGVDFISIGSITHSVMCKDIGLDIP